MEGWSSKSSDLGLLLSAPLSHSSLALSNRPQLTQLWFVAWAQTLPAGSYHIRCEVQHRHTAHSEVGVGVLGEPNPCSLRTLVFTRPWAWVIIWGAANGQLELWASVSIMKILQSASLCPSQAPVSDPCRVPSKV